MARQWVVFDMLSPVGEGYLKSSNVLITTTKVKAYFDESGQLITLFPLLR